MSNTLAFYRCSKNELRVTGNLSFRNGLAVFVLFLFVYNPRFYFFSHLGAANIIAAAGFVTFFVKSIVDPQRWLKFPRGFLIPTCFVLALTIYSTFAVSISGTFQFHAVFVYLSFLAKLTFGTFFVVFTASGLRPIRFHELALLIVLAAFCQAAIVILMLIFPSVSELISSINANPNEILLNRTNGVRGNGLAASLVYDLSIIQAVSLLLIVVLLNYTSKIRDVLLLSAMSIAIFFSILVSGRTGLVLVLLFPMLAFVNCFRSAKSRLNTFVFMFSFVVFVFAIVVSILLQEKLEIMERIWFFAFELFISASRGEGFVISSVQETLSMYIGFPDEGLFMGHGFKRAPDGDGYFMGTDVGYLRDVYFFGLLGAALLYGFYLAMFAKILTIILEERQFLLGAFFIGLALVFFGAHLKGDFLNSSMAPQFLFLIFGAPLWHSLIVSSGMDATGTRYVKQK